MSNVFLFCVAAAAVIGVAGLMSRSLKATHLNRRLQKIGGHGEHEHGDFPMWQIVLNKSSYVLLRSAQRRELTEQLARAGYYEKWHVELFLLVRTLIIVGGLIGGYFLFDVHISSLFKEPMPFFKWMILLAVAGRLPGWWLKDRAKANMQKIVAAVPQAVDFMTICVESGLSLEDAFEKVEHEMSRSAPEVASEMRITRSEMLMLDRTQALQRMKNRSGVREIEKLADALLQSIRFGTPLVETLQTIATDSRATQISSLEEQAGVISARVGVPLILLVLFPLIVLMAAPAIVQFIRTL